MLVGHHPRAIRSKTDVGSLATLSGFEDVEVAIFVEWVEVLIQHFHRQFVFGVVLGKADVGLRAQTHDAVPLILQLEETRCSLVVFQSLDTAGVMR